MDARDVNTLLEVIRAQMRRIEQLEAKVKRYEETAFQAQRQIASQGIGAEAAACNYPREDSHGGTKYT